MQSYTQEFLQKYKDQLTPEYSPDHQLCKIYSTCDSDLEKLAKKIKQGKQVSFPTETVYGLGADATNEKAIRSIYTTKGRPLTDPVIVHISSMDMINSIANQQTTDLEMLQYLGESLWPGPITFIVPANLDYIPSVVTANTGYVGIRLPQNEIARKLIELSNTPICAPSANRFAHISPTSSVHVFNDLYDKKISLIDGESAKHGLESTVVKIVKNDDERAQYVLRHGSVPTSKIKQLIQIDKRFNNGKVNIYEKDVEKSESITTKAEAPGQLLKHYCPKITTYMLNKADSNSNDYSSRVEEIELNKTVLVDFNNSYKDYPLKVLKRLDLSSSGDVEEAMKNFYDFLRQAELTTNATKILVVGKNDFKKGVNKGREFYFALYDKMFRSASGQILHMNLNDKGDLVFHM